MARNTYTVSESQHQYCGSIRRPYGDGQCITGNIFFKFARDLHGVYGGDDGAGKSAGHELKSLRALIGCDVDGLSFPLMCTIDYKYVVRLNHPASPASIHLYTEPVATAFVLFPSFPSATLPLFMGAPLKGKPFIKKTPF